MYRFTPLNDLYDKVPWEQEELEEELRVYQERVVTNMFDNLTKKEEKLSSQIDQLQQEINEENHKLIDYHLKYKEQKHSKEGLSEE